MGFTKRPAVTKHQILDVHHGAFLRAEKSRNTLRDSGPDEWMVLAVGAVH